MTTPFWQAPTMPWIAKLARAGQLLDDLARLLDGFLPSAYTLDYEPGGLGETHVRVVDAKPVPIAVKTLTGDVVHNLRSSLDTVAYELAQRSNNGSLPAKSEQLPSFPIFNQEHDYKTFFTRLRSKQVFDAGAEDALRSVAPGWDYSPEAVLDGQPILTFQQAAEFDHLWSLHRLSVIDKHRRLNVIAWWPDQVWWVNRQGEGPNWRWGTPPFGTGSILGTFVNGQPPDRGDLTATLILCIAEAGVHGGRAAPVISTLRQIGDYIHAWVLPRVWHGY